MPLVGPTPVSWIANQGAREDEQMRMMMQMALATRQYEQEQARLQQQATHQSELENIGWANAQSYNQSLNQPKPPQPTDLMQNYEFFKGLGYPDQAIPGMILPNMKPGAGSEGFQYDLDPATAADMEKTLRLPQGAASMMGPRQRQDAYETYRRVKFPPPDTNVPQGQTPIGRQVAYLNTMLQDLEQRRASKDTQYAQASRAGDQNYDKATADGVIAEYETKINAVRGALSRITATGQPLPENEWKVLDQSIMGSASGGYSQMAQEIAKEMGISPELAEQYIKKAIGQ